MRFGCRRRLKCSPGLSEVVDSTYWKRVMASFRLSSSVLILLSCLCLVPVSSDKIEELFAWVQEKGGQVRLTMLPRINPELP